MESTFAITIGDHFFNPRVLVIRKFCLSCFQVLIYLCGWKMSINGGTIKF